MEGGRAEEKIAGPLFPRLHVNDTDKGGPRAPPRNKMALYEQLSIPSQRFSSPAPASALPLPRHNASTPVPSASSSQGGGHDRGMFSPFHLSSHKSAHSTEKVHSRSSDGMNLDTCGMDIEKKSAKHTTQRTENASRHLLSAAESSSFRPHASTKDSCVKISEDEDDFRVPTFIDSRTAPYFDQDPPHVINREGPTPYYANSSQKCSAASFNSSAPLPISHDKPLERPSTTDLIPRQHEKSSVNKRAKETVTPEEDKVNTSHLETGERTAEPSNFAKESSHQGHSSCAVNALGNPELVNTRICQQSGGNGILVGPRFLDDSEVMDKGDASRMRKGSSSKISLRSNFRSQNMAENFNAESVDKVPGSSELRYTDINDEISETSMVDSLSGFDISPDDVVGLIGPKHFWKARKAIVNQQRVFAVQVFELHRLIKVQKLIAASPHLLLEGSPYLCQSPPQALNKTLSSKCNGKSEPEISKQKDDSQRLDNNMCHVENTEGMTPLFSSEDGLGKGSAGQVPRNVPYSGNTTVPVTSDYKPGAWCLHPPGNQWLIPVLSPSEGLIYKPYAGPYPPAAGFMAPVYGGCGPLSLPPVTGDFMNTAYGVPAAHQQQNIGVYRGPPAVSPNYFPTPYGLPVVNSIVSTSAVEHVSQLAGPCPSWQAEQHSRSSCNMSKPRNEALTGCVNFQTSKGNELQGSTASSPCERVQGEGRGASPPFPIALATKGTGRPMQDHGGDHQARVIKVVPHNPRSATESAARIFRSIQRERQQCESM